MEAVVNAEIKNRCLASVALPEFLNAKNMGVDPWRRWFLESLSTFS